MRSLSFRSQLLLLMLTPVLVTTVVLGWLVYRSASETLSENAVRAVGIAARAREQALVMRLGRQQERAATFLRLAAADCAPGKGPERGACLQAALSNFLATEGALGARLVAPGLEPLHMGQGVEALANLSSLPAGQLARFEPKRDAARAYDMLIQQAGLVLGLRFDAALLEPIFQERYGLGRSGETFLADPEGLFITTPKYPGHTGEHRSHPIDARPMRQCLSGEDSQLLAGDYRDVPVIHGFRFIEEIGGGCIMAHIEQAEAFAPVRALGARIAGAAVALGALAVGLSFIFSRRLSLPVSLLTDKARALQAGNFDVAVLAQGPRELKTFAETFMKMARSLQASSEERTRLLVRETTARREVEAERTRLEILAGLSRALAESRLALQSILDTTCRQLADRIGDVCTLRLISPDGQWLEVSAVSARDAAVEARTRALLQSRPQRVTEGPSVQVLASGEPLLIPVVTETLLEQLRPHLPPQYHEYLSQFRPHSFVSVALRSSARVIGVLTLLRLKADDAPYGEDDVLLFREIADRAALAIENARLYQQQQEAVRVRDDLVAVVSHDLRNPISAISMSASVLLKREGLLDWQAKGLSRIYSAADRALRLIRDLLDSTQARVEGIPVEPRPLDFHALAGHVVEEVQLAHPERRILFEASGEAHGAWDADRVAQVITNLVGNAVQHSPEGTPVRVGSRGMDGQVLLEVHNEGPPIPADLVPRLFEPFRRGRSAGGALGSVGLGLFISRRLVEAHAGTIEVTSTEGEGTTFTVRLPRSLPPAPTAP